MEQVCIQLIGKYPCLEEKFEDGRSIGSGYETLLQKMINRRSNSSKPTGLHREVLNSLNKTNEAREPRKKTKKIKDRNSLPLNAGHDAVNAENKRVMAEGMAKESIDHAVISTLVAACFTCIRFDIAKGENVASIKANWPGLFFYMKDFVYIFRLSLKKNITLMDTQLRDLLRKVSERPSLEEDKDTEIIETIKKNQKILADSPGCVKEYVTWDVMSENPCDAVDPVIIVVGQQGFRHMIVVYVDLVEICECNTMLEALLTWYMSYWVFGIKYGNQKGLLTVMERDVAKMEPVKKALQQQESEYF